MTFGTRYGHKTASFTITINSNPYYKKLADLAAADPEGTVYPVYALFVTNGKYGEQALACIAPDTMINLPAHTVKTVKEMLTDADAIEAMNAGKAGFSVYSYTTKNGRTGHSVNWVDRTPGDKDPLPF